MKRLILTVTAITLVIIAISCEEEGEIAGGSHNTGKNCLGCHSDFKLAGSVYDKTLSSPLSGITIKVTSQANGAGSVLATLTSDASGNFHTSNSISFGSGVYVSAQKGSGAVKYMGSAITTGGCNACHGSSTSKLWVE